MPSHASLDAAAQERKARLAKLKSLKRKAPDTNPDEASSPTTQTLPDTSQLSLDSKPTPASSTPHLSGRNYDASTRSAKLGFEHDPAAEADTAEKRAAELAAAARAEAEREEKEEAEEEAARQLDLFRLRPKKANWDLRRDVEKRMERLNVQTENAIARAVRERVEGQRRKAVEEATGREGVNGKGESRALGNGDGTAEDVEVGLKGEELVSALHAKERQEEEEEKREREEDEEEEEGFK